jgi:hypothetical protein
MPRGKKQYVQKHLYVPQERLVVLGLHGAVGIREAVVLSYLYGWFRYKGAKTIRVDGARFIWLNYGRMVCSLPLLNLISAKGNVNRRAVREVLDRLVAANLIETHTAQDMTVYFRLLPLALAVFAKDEPTAGRDDVDEDDDHAVAEGEEKPCEDSHGGDVTERTGAGEESHGPPLAGC